MQNVENENIPSRVHIIKHVRGIVKPLKKTSVELEMVII